MNKVFAIVFKRKSGKTIVMLGKGKRNGMQLWSTKEAAEKRLKTFFNASDLFIVEVDSSEIDMEKEEIINN